MVDLRYKTSVSDEEQIPILLLANKCDLKDSRIKSEEIDNFCSQHEITGWFPSSAKDGINIGMHVTFMILKYTFSICKLKLISVSYNIHSQNIHSQCVISTFISMS